MNWMMWIVMILMAVILLPAILFYFRPKLLIDTINIFITRVPTGDAALKTRFEKIVAKYENGLIFTIPFVHKVKILPLRALHRIPITAKVQTKSGDSLDVIISLEYQTDFNLLEQYFYAMEEGEEHYGKMLENSIITLIEIIASTKPLEAFYQSKEALWMALNCYARLSVMPHINPEKWGITDKPAKGSKILEFYGRHKAKVAELLNNEGVHLDDYSEIELRYGNNITTVDRIEIRLSPETQSALNRKEHDEAMARAAKFKLELMRSFKGEGLSPEDAATKAEVSLGQTTKNDAFNVSGLKNAINIVIGGGK